MVSQGQGVEPPKHSKRKSKVPHNLKIKWITDSVTKFRFTKNGRAIRRNDKNASQFVATRFVSSEAG